jgi:hypothetical protein
MAGILISLDLFKCVDAFFGIRALRGSFMHSIPALEVRQEKALRDGLAEGVI